MSPLDIHYALRKSGTSQAEIARTLNVSTAAVRRVLTGETASRRIATRIAQAIGKRPSEIWPGRYETPVRRAA